MRWVTKRTDPPKGGDIRHIKKFAWKKTKVGRFTVWLEFYWITERFFQPASGSQGWWTETGRDLCNYYP
jgi:hypothetical protein